MKYNEKYDLYLDEDFVIYYWDKNNDKLMQRSICKNKDGYSVTRTKIGTKLVHRIIYETFVGPIPDGYEIDHINTIRDDNRLDNLRCITHKDNCNNSITKNNYSKSKKGNTNAKGNKITIMARPNGYPGESPKDGYTWTSGTYLSQHYTWDDYFIEV
jgi:hypothetical protein